MKSWALGVLLCAHASTAGAAPPAAAAERIDADGLRARIRFLSHDLLEGRRAGTRGYDASALWVATELEALGLEPAGGDGTFFQPVPLVRSRLEPAPVLTIVGRKGRREVRDPHVMIAPSPTVDGLDLDAEVVFVGYGIEAPHLGHDDYRGVDVRGRVVAVLSQAPESFPGDERAHHGSADTKEAVAARHGAVGLVGLLAGGPDTPAWRAMLGATRRGVVRFVPRDGKTHLPVLMALTGEGSAALLEGSGRTLEQLRKKPRSGLRLPVRVQVRGTAVRETFTSANVAARLPGRDPALSGETVVFSAHLDHLGTRPGQPDEVMNGAIDNASGVAGLLEIAEAFVAAPERPLRSVLFLAVTAEEMGLLGSAYFAAHPTVPAEGIVANVNLDMLPMQPRLQPLREVVAFGAEHSSLADVVGRAASAAGLRVVPDPMAEQRIFVRSDQYSFVRQGVPAVMLFGGGGEQPGGAWISDFHDWLSHTYHSAEDELQPGMDLAGAVTISRVSFAVGWEIATERERPRWKPHDFFGRTFGAGRR